MTADPAPPGADETMTCIGQAIALGQQGRRAEARAASALGDDAYGAMIKAGLEGLAERLAAGGTTSPA